MQVTSDKASKKGETEIGKELWNSSYSIDDGKSQQFQEAIRNKNSFSAIIDGIRHGDADTDGNI